MRIAFIVPCLQPGKDGIGDVTRRLAGILKKMGHEPILISWNDTVSEATDLGFRYKKEEAWGVNGISKILKTFNPNAVSLQFIHYAFDSKGLLFKWIDRIKITLSPYPLHLFLHELWIGVHQGASWKHRLLGSVQRFGILKMIRSLNPVSIQTSNTTYQNILKAYGVCSSVVRHCPGIVPHLNSKENNLLKINNKIFDPTEKLKYPNRLWILIFGAIHPEANLDQFFSRLIDWGVELGRRPLLISIGRQTPGEIVWNRYQSNFNQEIDFLKVGECENEIVSCFMQESDLGLTTTPYPILGKSSVVAAMLEHGLPVIAYRNQTYKKNIFSDERFDRGVMTPLEAKEDSIRLWDKKKILIDYDANQIADQWIKNLRHAIRREKP